MISPKRKVQRSAAMGLSRGGLALPLALCMSTLFPGVSVGQPLNGLWAVGEGEGPGEVEGLLDVQGERATFMRPGGQRPPMDLTVTTVSPGVYELQEVGHRDVLVFVMQGAGDAIGFERGDDDAGRALRVQPVPAALLGEWELSEPRGSGPRVSQLVVSTDTLRLSRDTHVEEGPAYGLTSPEGRYRLVFFPSGRDGRVLDFHPLPDGTYLAFSPGDDDFGILHRPGAPPSWMPAASAATGSGAESAQTGDLCAEMLRHLEDCVAQYCDPPSSPVCDELSDLDEIESECHAQRAVWAEEVLSLSCEEIVGGP